jgi:hypothetical protein
MYWTGKLKKDERNIIQFLYSFFYNSFYISLANSYFFDGQTNYKIIILKE